MTAEGEAPELRRARFESGEPSRARYPDTEGYIDRDGVRVFWERYGDGEPTLLFVTTPWPIAHSRIWRGQIPYLAHHHRVLCSDPRGNGRSDRPRESEAYALSEVVQDALDVLDASGTEGAVLIAASYASGIRKAELPAIVARIRCPALVVCGELDTINPLPSSRARSRSCSTRHW